MILLLPSPPKATVTPWGGPLGAGQGEAHGEKDTDSHCKLSLKPHPPNSNILGN